MKAYKLSRAICFWIFALSLLKVIAEDDGRFWGAMMIAAAIGFALFDYQMFWTMKNGGEE